MTTTYPIKPSLYAITKTPNYLPNVLMQMEAPTNLGGSYTRRFHQAYGRAATATGVTLLPFLLEGVAGDARFNQADGIHPNVEGSQRVAETVWRGLSPLLAKLAGG